MNNQRSDGGTNFRSEAEQAIILNEIGEISDVSNSTEVCLLEERW